MLIYRSVGASAIAAIMAAHRQPARKHRDSGVCRGSIDTGINWQATGRPDSRTCRPVSIEANAESTQAPSVRDTTQARP